jgi:tRNA modification GTPase
MIDGLVGRRLPARHAILCEFRDGKGNEVDRGLAIYYPAPRSYTGEDMLELQGHGGPVVLRSLLRRCLELGARIAQPGEFTRRAYLNEKLDLAQAEGVIDLIDAATEQAARCAIRSLSGEFSKVIQELTHSLTDLRALLEGNFDFPEDELDALSDMNLRVRLSDLEKRCGAVLDMSRQGSLLREGMDVVLAGLPNVGKSSLLNRLAGEELAIVTEVPGTTRDLIRQIIDLDGVPVRVIDTAGLRQSGDLVERLGIERAWGAIAVADAVVVMVDAQRGMTAEDYGIVEKLPHTCPRVLVYNKIDLADVLPRVEQAGDLTKVWMSAKTGAGVELLRQALLHAIGWKGAHEGLYLARERHLDALAGAHTHLRKAEAAWTQLEFVAEELRLAQLELSSITGEFTADDLLGEIFSRFCIGK